MTSSAHIATAQPITLTGRRSVLIAPQRSQVETFSVTEPGPEQVLVEVLANGVCASDLATWEDGPEHGEPIALGHEPVGRVIAAGPGVHDQPIGQLVTGRLTQSFADYVIASTTDVVPVPSAIPIEGAVGEPLGCVTYAVRQAGIDVGDHVAVIGLGFMGLCVAQVLRSYPTAQLVGIDPRASARQAAQTHGVCDTIADEHNGNALPTNSFDVVFETSGTQAGLTLATALLREHGRLSIVGFHRADRLVDMQTWNWKALTVLNGHVRDRQRLAESTRRGLALVAAGRMDYPALFTHRYSLDGLDQAFRDLREKPDGFVKALILLRDI